VVTSNPSLKPQNANNYDLAVEYFFEPAGMLSAGVFLKKITDFIFTAGGQPIGNGTNNGFDGRYEGYSLTSQQNGGTAEIKGLELNYQQQFNFLPGWMKGFGAFANHTRLKTEGNYGANVVRSTSEVAGFTPKITNLGLFYIRQPITVRLHFNHASRYLQTFNANTARMLYKTGRSTIDIKTVYTFNRHFDAYFDVINVLREPDRAFMWYGERPQTIQDHRPMFYFGVNARL
jgi:TonB-dependent receptor